MYTIQKEFHFSASHCLAGLAPEHPCTRVHGHNYIVIVEFSARKLNDVGMIIDYRELEPIKKLIDNNLDHRHLNDAIKGMNPTAENLADYLYGIFHVLFPQITAVVVKETDKTAARYTPDTY